MATPKLFRALKTLSKEEWSSLRTYLLSRTGKETDNYLCFEVIRKKKASLMKEGVDEAIRNKHFPNLSAKSFSNILSRLFGWFEDWFAIESLLSEKYARELALVKGYNKRGLYKYADHNYEKIRTEIKSKVAQNLAQTRMLSELDRAMYYSYNPIKAKKDSTIFEDSINSHLQHTNEQSLVHLLEVVNKSIYKKRDYKILQSSLRDLIHSDLESDISLILADSIKLLKDPDTHNLEILIQKLHSGTIDTSSDLYMILTSSLDRASVFLWNNKKMTDVSLFKQVVLMKYEAIDLHKHLKVRPVHMFNLVTAYAETSSYEETHKLIESWHKKVHTAYPDSVLKYSYAINEFRHENYSRIPELLNGLPHDKVVHKLIANCMVIIAYFELNEHDLFHTLLSNFKKQLNRNASLISNLIVNGMSNLLKIIYKMEEAKTDSSVQIDLEKYNPIFFRTWVAKKLKIEQK